jgi:hypothetical protein
MEVQQQPTRSGFGAAAANVIAIIVGLATLVVLGAILWWVVKDGPRPSTTSPQPTSDTRRLNPTPVSDTTTQDSPVSVPSAIDAYNATATAAWDAAQPVQNVGQGEPVTIGQRTNEREPAPAVVPTAEPVVEGSADDLFGSKPAVVNPQETHECRHTQVWTDSGCKNPTPEVK